MLLRDGECQVAALDAVFVLDETLAPCQPGVRLNDLPLKQEAAGKPERAACGARPVVRLDVDAMQALEEPLILEVAPDQERDSRQPVEIVSLEGRHLIGAQESLVGVTPRTASVALAAVFKMIHRTCVEPNHTRGSDP